MADVLPDLDAIPDTPEGNYFIKQCFRALQDRVGKLEAEAAKVQEEEAAGEGLEARLGVVERKVTALENAPEPAPTPAPDDSHTCRVYRNAATSIAHNIPVTLSFNTERWDVGAMHDTATNPSRITIQTAGKYAIGGSVEVSNSGTTMWVFVGILRNGTTYVVTQAPSVVGQTAYVSLETVIDGVVGDYYELLVYQYNSGSATESIASAGERSPEFWAHQQPTKQAA